MCVRSVLCCLISGVEQSFSAIVGPNGSGKSNVIDALLFVFGKRAKQIRLNKVSELIHKSDEYSGFAFAKVDVHFAEIVDQVPIPIMCTPITAANSSLTCRCKGGAGQPCCTGVRLYCVA